MKANRSHTTDLPTGFPTISMTELIAIFTRTTLLCFIFTVMLFFSLEIAKKCFFVLYFLKNVLYFCKLFKWVEYLFQVFIYDTKIGEL